MSIQEGNRLKYFKNRGKDIQEMLRRRNEITVQLRKQKKDQQMSKRRYITGNKEPLSPVYRANKVSVMSMEELIQGIQSDDPEIRLKATQSSRRILCWERYPPIDCMIQAGVLPKFVEFLSDDKHPSLQFEAAWAITNIASGNSEQTQSVVAAGAVQSFIKLLSSPHVNVCEQAVRALGNIAGDGTILRDFVIQNGIIPPLLELIKSDIPIPFLRNVAWTMSNLVRNESPPPSFEVVKALTQLIYHSDKEVVANACWALSYIDDVIQEMIPTIAGVLPRLIELLECSETSIIIPALRAIGSILAGNYVQTQAVIDRCALPPFHNLPNCSKVNIKRDDEDEQIAPQIDACGYFQFGPGGAQEGGFMF